MASILKRTRLIGTIVRRPYESALMRIWCCVNRCSLICFATRTSSKTRSVSALLCYAAQTDSPAIRFVFRAVFGVVGLAIIATDLEC